MRPDLSPRTASGAQRIVWLIPALFLLGVADTDPVTAACAAVLVAVAWQCAYRRPPAIRLTVLAACWTGSAVLVLLGLATWPVRPVPLTALAVLAATLVVTERALRAVDRMRVCRDDRTVPAGT